ncbi:hypothetical protein JI735_33655 (plasmid) [Paenibacillus sonchi]|uniref:Uncharacterized protein n=1 Tax=Paenibacillus sonchi TaxID=373687 RepID=A0A974PJ82_9BACL|nr:hypothetical protein [Paenibacillus sonchi]QQZ64598.1 hypothetical protein JI735_33655 [Paenibacillus sonchi]
MEKVNSSAEEILEYHEEDLSDDPTSSNAIVMSGCLDVIPVVEICMRCGKKGRTLNFERTGICQVCALLSRNPYPKEVCGSDRLSLTGWAGAEYEISSSLLKGQDGIIVHLEDGPPDTNSMTVYWSGYPTDIIILDEVLDPAFYEPGINPLLLGYNDGLLFHILAWEKFDTEDYLLHGVFQKEAAIKEAEKLLRSRYAPAPGGELV